MEKAMEATVVDLRYKMNDIIKALDRNEEVEILYHGKPKGTIIPTIAPPSMRVKDHPFFNMDASTESIDQTMDGLRGGRCRDL